MCVRSCTTAGTVVSAVVHPDAMLPTCVCDVPAPRVTPDGCGSQLPAEQWMTGGAITTSTERDAAEHPPLQPDVMLRSRTWDEADDQTSIGPRLNVDYRRMASSGSHSRSVIGKSPSKTNVPLRSTRSSGDDFSFARLTPNGVQEAPSPTSAAAAVSAAAAAAAEWSRAASGRSATVLKRGSYGHGLQPVAILVCARSYATSRMTLLQRLLICSVFSFAASRQDAKCEL